MSDKGRVNPEMNPELAAQEITMELIRAGAFTITNPGSSPAYGRGVAQAVTNAHSMFLSYYKGLEGDD